VRPLHPPLPPLAAPNAVTVPPVAEMPKTAGPRPPLDRVAEPPLPGGALLTSTTLPPLPPVAIAEIVTWSRAIPLAWAFALPPLSPPWPKPPQKPLAMQTLPPNPPWAVEETDALGTLITIAFEDALPPVPPAPETPNGDM